MCAPPPQSGAGSVQTACRGWFKPEMFVIQLFVLRLWMFGLVILCALVLMSRCVHACVWVQQMGRCSVNTPFDLHPPFTEWRNICPKESLTKLQMKKGGKRALVVDRMSCFTMIFKSQFWNDACTVL